MHHPSHEDGPLRGQLRPCDTEAVDGLAERMNARRGIKHYGRMLDEAQASLHRVEADRRFERMLGEGRR